MPMNPENSHIRDGWTCSPGYINQYQTETQIRELIAGLDLELARSLADIGCGNGAVSVAAAKYPALTVHALDPLEGAVTECRHRANEAGAGRLKADIASSDNLPLPEGTVDRILMRNVLHHVADADMTYREFARVLQPDGLLVLEASCNPGDTRLGSLISDIHILMDDTHRRTYHRPEDAAAQLAAHGLTTFSSRTWPYTNRISDGQMQLIRKQEAEASFAPCPLDDGRWTIEFNLMRLIARRK